MSINNNDVIKKSDVENDNVNLDTIKNNDSFLIDDVKDLSDDPSQDDVSLEEAYLYQSDLMYKKKLEKNDDLYYQDVLNTVIDSRTSSLIAGPCNSLISSTYLKMNIPIFVNEYVVDQYKYFLGGKRTDLLSTALERAEPFIGEMKQIFKDNNLPDDLAYLPLIESAYFSQAVSRKGAVGMWQFMPYTARIVGMKINEWVDERRDPLIACKFAAKYLSMLYDKFGDWYLALASYNHGGFNVLKDIKKGGSSNFYDLVKKKIPPYETRTYVPRFVASLVVLRNLDKYNVEFNEEKRSFEYYLFPFMTPAQLVAKYSNLDYKEFMKLNPALTGGFVPDPKYNYKLRLPKENLDILVSNIDEIKKDTSVYYIPYYVRKGDTLSEIAQRNGISLPILISANNLNSKRILSIGQKIFLPLRGYQIRKPK
jgi:membrane-bound lytic murein transglycosylase D